jgi:hypothetical protein
VVPCAGKHPTDLVLFERLGENITPTQIEYFGPQSLVR